MTAWQEYSAADFDTARADKRAARKAAEAARAGQAGLFFMATPERETKPTPGREQLPGQEDMFAGSDPCTCRDCRPDPYPPDSMRPDPGHWICCGQHYRGPCCQRTTT